MNISEQELEIFSRHLILKDFNDSNFRKLQKKKVTIIGMGGIGCPTAQYLVATGIKNIKLIDRDKVQKNNLNRQILYSIKDIGQRKTNIAQQKLNNINPECNIQNIMVPCGENPKRITPSWELGLGPGHGPQA